jgi:F-type H+-transporting ATPase subunit a
MADPVLHIKDAYYFEVPKFLWPSHRESKSDFPDVWVSLDDDFQKIEAEELHLGLERIGADPPPLSELEHDWEHWRHEDHANHGKPLDVYLEENAAALKASYDSFHENAKGSEKSVTYGEWLEKESPDWVWFAGKYGEDEAWTAKWNEVKVEAGGEEAIAAYKSGAAHPWSKEKIESYNKALSGKVLIPQPFGATLRNLYEKESGFAVSKYMIIEVVIAIIIVALFTWLASRVRSGGAPKGKLWNFLEGILLFVRDQVARPAIGHGSDKFVPLLWTIFLFILGCNLFGMLPWAGSPTANFAVTFAMACVTLGAVIFFGSRQFGLVGFWKNLLPHMDLPIYIAVIIKPFLWVIELFGLIIKHGVLSVRLLANMVAGHLVLLAIMGLAFSLEGAMNPSWGLTAVIAVIASTLLSVLEVFVAILQAYIFTFLSALFIGAAVHHH